MRKRSVLVVIVLITVFVLTGCSSKRSVPWGNNLMHREVTEPSIDLDYITNVKHTVDDMIKNLLPETVGGDGE